MKIEDDYCSEEIMILAGEKGFEDCQTPVTHNVMRKWLMLKHNLHVQNSVGSNSEFGVLYGGADTPLWVRENDDIDVKFFPTPEAAREAGIIHALKLL